MTRAPAARARSTGTGAGRAASNAYQITLGRPPAAAAVPPDPEVGMPARSLFRAVALTSLAVSGLAATLAGCGSQVAGAPARPAARPAVSVNPGGPDIPAPSGGAPAPSSVPSAPPTPGAACGGMRLQPAPAGTGVLTLHNSSNGRTFCVQAGERVDVYLTGAPGRMWASIQSDSSSLVAVTHGQLTLPVGETGAFFATLHQGVAHLSSARQVCAAKPIHCDALIAFRVTVIVSGHQ